MGARCPIRRHPSAVPLANRAGGPAPGELLVGLSILHVGAAHPDDESPGVPAARRQVESDMRHVEFDASRKLQCAWRCRIARATVGRRRGKAPSKHEAASTGPGQVGTPRDPSDGWRRFCEAWGEFLCNPCSSIRQVLRGHPSRADSEDYDEAWQNASLLPTGFELSDADRGDDPQSTHRKGGPGSWGREELLRLTLCLLCLSIGTCLAAAMVLFKLTQSSESE